MRNRLVIFSGIALIMFGIVTNSACIKSSSASLYSASYIGALTDAVSYNATPDTEVITKGNSTGTIKIYDNNTGATIIATLGSNISANGNTIASITITNQLITVGILSDYYSGSGTLTTLSSNGVNSTTISYTLTGSSAFNTFQFTGIGYPVSIGTIGASGSTGATGPTGATGTTGVYSIYNGNYVGTTDDSISDYIWDTIAFNLMSNGTILLSDKTTGSNITCAIGTTTTNGGISTAQLTINGQLIRVGQYSESYSGTGTISSGSYQGYSANNLNLNLTSNTYYYGSNPFEFSGTKN